MKILLTFYIFLFTALSYAYDSTDRPITTDHSPCGIDEVFDYIKGDLNDQIGTPKICPKYPTGFKKLEHTSHPNTWSPFDYDQDGIKKSAELKHPGYVFRFAEPLFWKKNVIECYYLGCTKVQVSSVGRPIGGKYFSCVGPFTGGTSKLSPKFPGCPGAIKIRDEYRVIISKDSKGYCCYEEPGPVPPQ